jgi:hypothetical protein
MKVRVPMMVQDPLTSLYKGLRIIERFDIKEEKFLIDGPVSERVAVLDFEPKTGGLCPGACFIPAPESHALSKYEIADEDNIYSPDFIQVSAFATVLKTMYLFEHERALGRRLKWAFEAPQLLVVPRAGMWANAFYERESHSLQLFFFSLPKDRDRKVFTSLSRDIVAHETGHAILDGIAPDLYNAISPQSLALHEAIADLTALLMAFDSYQLRKAVLDQTNGSITESNAFSSVAEEFGKALYPERGTAGLRSLLNQKSLNPQDPEYVGEDEPHALSEVLSGALYSVMVRIHNNLKTEYARKSGASEFTVSGRALAIGADRFRRLAFRALDYLQPGEVSFADYGRAILAADQVAFPGYSQEREWIADEFVRRAIVPTRQALEVETNVDYAPLKRIDLNTLMNSEWAAYEFANENRPFLGIPEGIHFRVRPRQRVSKRIDRDGKRQERIECLFKVSWDHKEPNQLGPGYPSERQITLGTTLAIDWDTGTVLAKLTCHPDEERAGRDLLLRRLIEEGVLLVGHQAMGPDGQWLRSAIRAETMNGLMRVRATARMLHIARAFSESEEVPNG